MIGDDVLVAVRRRYNDFYLCLFTRRKTNLETEIDKLNASKHELQRDIRYVTTLTLCDYTLRDTFVKDTSYLHLSLFNNAEKVFLNF